MGFMRLSATVVTMRPRPATKKKGARQPRCDAMERLKGTPAMEATAKALATRPMALPRRETGMASETMEIESAVAGPPKAPAMTRAPMSEWRSQAKPPAAVPMTRPSMATASALRRSKRSRKVAAAKPESAAEIP